MLLPQHQLDLSSPRQYGSIKLSLRGTFTVWSKRIKVSLYCIYFVRTIAISSLTRNFLGIGQPHFVDSRIIFLIFCTPPVTCVTGTLSWYTIPFWNVYSCVNINVRGYIRSIYDIKTAMTKLIFCLFCHGARLPTDLCRLNNGDKPII